MLLNVPRWLAGGDGALKYATEDRQQREAHFFSGSMAIVFFCSDTMILTHRGLKDNMGRCLWGQQTTKAKIFGIILLLLRAGLIAFITSLSQYETEPEHLAAIGLAAICGQVILRFVSALVFPSDHGHMTMEEARDQLGAILDPDEEDEAEEEHSDQQPQTGPAGAVPADVTTGKVGQRHQGKAVLTVSSRSCQRI